MALLGFLVTGCAYQETAVKSPTFDQQLDRPQPAYTNGSIWQASSSGLADDFKARRRGDILTIVIAEQASASKQASTKTSRASEISAGIPNLLGMETEVASKIMTSKLPKYMDKWDWSKLLNASTDSQYDGSGSTSRDESLKATISAKVTDVLPNGNLLIEGRRNIKVNNEDQIIVLEGTVRPRDITADNTVSSVYIADARISYSGKGVVSDRQSPGWLMNIIDKVWPF
jgi:flagellar L-ring protein precursor FlgH